MQTIFWTGYSNDERHSSISAIQQIVAKYGDIVDYKLFSDISITITIEIMEFKIDNLYNKLSEIIGINKFDYLNSVMDRERTIYLNITFTKGTGNLVVQAPSVPG